MSNSEDPLVGLDPGTQPSATSADRLYKACRTCRRQKMRCEGRDGASCRRCINAGVPCVFDKAVLKRRSPAAEGTTKRQKTQALADELSALKAQVASLRQSRGIQDTPTSSYHPQERRQDRTGRHSTISSPPSSPAINDVEAGFSHAFSPENLGMPVTAVHAMIHPPGIGEPERNSAGWTVENQSRWNREDNSKHARQDVIARGLLYEDEARHLFDIFMHGGNVFFPVFDPFLDTFDSVRQRSAFTLTVVLYIAARHEYIHSPGNHTLQVCMEEARRFAADSLFENPSSLETTEAMALLAVHSDTTWFALGHAHQMAMDLGLDTKLRSFISNSGSTPTKPQATKTMRYAFRCSRLLLLIAQYERALAFGTIRRTRIEHFRFEDMERFLNNAHSHPSAVFPCAAIDLWQCLTRLRASIDTLSIDDVERETKTWFDKWDSLLEDNSIHQGSFQRSHLMLQYHYSRIILSAILLVSMIKSRGTSQLQSPLAVQQRVSVSTRILQLVRDLLAAIEDCTVFKRVFSWAPTYDGLILTFAIILGFQILQFVPDPVQETALLEQVEQTNKLLKKHPCQNFYAVVKRLIHGAKSSKANSASTLNQNLDENWPYDVIDYTSILQGEDWVFDIGNCVFFDPDRFADTDIA